MKKLALAFASFMVLSLALGGLVGYIGIKAVDVVREAQPVAVEPQKPHTTEYVMVQSETEKGLYQSMPIDENSKLENGYLIDKKKNIHLGDIVEITYHNDDLMKERKVTGKELEKIQDKYAVEINSLMEDGIRNDYVSTQQVRVTELGQNEFAFAQDADGEQYVILKDGLNLGDIVEVKENIYGEVTEQKLVASAE